MLGTKGVVDYSVNRGEKRRRYKGGGRQEVDSCRAIVHYRTR